MSGREDTRLVDQLYGELSEKEAREYRRALEEDPALASEAEALESFEETLGLMRGLEEEEPSPHLDALILAHAREEAEKLAENEKGLRGFLKKIFRSPAIGLAVAGTVAVVALVMVPATLLRDAAQPAETAARIAPAQEAPVVALDEAPPPPPTAQPSLKSEQNAPTAAADFGGPGEGESARKPRKMPSRAKHAARPVTAEKQPAPVVEKERPADDDVGGLLGGASTGVAPQRREQGFDELAKVEEASGDVANEQARERPFEEPQAPAPVTSTPKVDAVIDPASAGRYAADVIRAAETQLGLKDSIGARRILINGLTQTQGTPAYGEIVLRLAQLDYAERRLADAARNARVAANVPAFAKRRMALDLADRAEREAAASQAIENEAAKAKRAAPAPAEAESIPEVKR